MLFHHLQLAVRHLYRQKFNSIVHILGLTLGISVCVLIGLFLHYELTFDTHHANAERTYRINSVWIENGKSESHFATQMPLVPALRQEISGLDAAVRVHQGRRNIIDLPDGKRFDQERVVITEPQFFDVFAAEVLKGDGRDALAKPYQALLTASTARKFFGTDDVIGKTFRYKKDFDITVAGVIKDFPATTHLPVTMLLSFVENNRFLGSGVDAWSYTNNTCAYVVVPDGYDMLQLDAHLKRLADTHINADPNLPKFLRAGFEAQALHTIHFDTSGRGAMFVQPISKTWLWFFAAIGIAVLGLACINFVNLSTAQSLTRAREVGVRKSIGAGKSNLILQFLSETWLLTTVATILAIAAIQISLPYINTVLERQISFELRSTPALWLILAVAAFVIGLFAGLYPSMIIARYNPATTLKAGNAPVHGMNASWLRSGLVVAQFTISGGLLIALMLIANQVEFMRTKDLGFKKDNIVTIQADRRAGRALKTELLQLSQVKDVSMSTQTPIGDGHWGTVMSPNKREDANRQGVTLVLGDENYCNMYGFNLLSGRFPVAADTVYVSSPTPDDKMVMKAVVNEKLVQAMNFGTPEEAIGKHFWFGMGNGDIEIIGVVSNFNAFSLHQQIKPVIIGQEPSAYETMGIRLADGVDIHETMAAIEATWKKNYPDGVFTYQFLDDRIDSFYRAETRLYEIFRVFAGMAIAISCLGLWGLVSFSAQRRTKEIGIRKVLGASAQRIVLLLSKDFVLMVVVALLIACPLVYFAAQEWLAMFEFRATIEWTTFAVAGATCFSLAIITVGYQALRASWTNPADVLKNE